MYKIVKKLCFCTEISKNEREITENVSKCIFPCSDVKFNEFGGIFAQLGSKNGKITLLFDAYIKKIGFIVTDIAPKGFLRLERCGGTDRRAACGSKTAARDLAMEIAGGEI